VRELIAPNGEVVAIPVLFATTIANRANRARHLGAVQSSSTTVEELISHAAQLGISPAAMDMYAEAVVSLNERSEFPQAVLIIAKATAVKVQLLVNEHKIQDALVETVGCLQMLHDCLPCVSPQWHRECVLALHRIGDQGLKLLGQFTRDDLVAGSAEIQRLCRLLALFWEADLSRYLKDLGNLLEAIRASDLENTFRLRHQASEIRQEIEALRLGSAKARDHKLLIATTFGGLAESLAVYTQRLSTRLNAASISLADLPDIVRGTIAEVEIRLRALIVQRYRQKFKAQWLNQVEVRHAMMYQHWTQNMTRDQAVHDLSAQDSERILDYSRLKDLVELVLAEWGIFGTVLDFSYSQNNKVIFVDRMHNIIQARNALAHNREMSENDLLRAYVFCRDVLKLVTLEDAPVEPSS
jgi:hypothetical protein